jgi:hypothetical protein
MIRMYAVAIDAKPVQGRDAHSNREVPVRSTADSWCALEDVSTKFAVCWRIIDPLPSLQKVPLSEVTYVPVGRMGPAESTMSLS